MKISIIRIFTIITLVSLLISCGRDPDLVGVDNPAMPVAKEKDASKRKIFIATTRVASEVTSVFYSHERAPELGFASVVVSIPPNHVTGNLERPKILPPDPETEFAIIEPVVYGSDQVFISNINRELAKLPAKDRNILLFVHGYNNTISDSLLRMAQFVEDTKFTGVPVLFSWASGGKARLYVYDLNSALTARPRFLEAANILGKTSATGFDIFAHSMGAFLTVESIIYAYINGDYNKSGRLNNVMLASPDIDLDLFKSQLENLPERDRNFFILVSKDDKALGFSRRISGGIGRVGATDAVVLEKLGVTVLDLSEIDNSTSGTHSKFAGSPEVVQLIGRSLKADQYNKAPSQPTLFEVLDGVPVVRVLAQ